MTITDADLGELAETQAWADANQTQAFSVTFVVKGATRERAIGRFMQFFSQIAYLRLDNEYGIVAAAVDLVPEEGS